VRYRFGPLERRGLVAGWRGGQIATVGTGLVAAVLVLRADSSLSGALVALGLVGTAVAAATWPVGGRTVEEWAPDALRHATGTNRRRHMRTDPFATLRLVPVDLATSGPIGSSRGPHRGARMTPGAPRAASLPAAGTALGQVGVVADDASRTYTAVLAASGAGFVLLGEQDKVQRIGAWAGVLSSLAREGSAVHRVQWVERNVPEADSAIADQLETAASAVDGRAAAYRSYTALVHTQTAASERHEVLIAVSVHVGKAARLVKAAGGGQVGACALVLRETATLRRRLADAGIDAGNVLGPEALARTFRRAFEPASTSKVVRAPGGDTWSAMGAARGESWDSALLAASRDEGTRPLRALPHGGCQWPWPMGVRCEWGRVHVDSTWHATYWISEWPRIDVGPDFLGPLLLLPEVRRAASVVMEPLGPAQAARRIEQARTADIADSELRRRGGFLATARRRREEELLVQREVELADGHAPFRFSGYVTVSATDLGELEDACAQTEQAAARCGLELRLCYGDQARAFLTTLPLGRGLS